MRFLAQQLWRSKDILYCLLLFIVALVFSLDLFLHQGRPATFDGPTHLTTMAQFFLGMKDGQFPVSWADGFANYGMPIPLIAQQLTSYLGGAFIFFTRDVVLAYNLVVLLGAVLSTCFFYAFLRLFFKQESSLAGSILFSLAPYRIINIYTRGAIPEFFVAVFIPLIAIGMVTFFRDKKNWGLPVFLIGLCGLILSHPMMLVPASFILAPVALVASWSCWKNWRQVLVIGFLTGAAFALTAYYLVPLFGEIKYLYYGQGTNHFISNNFLTWKNYFQPAWPYYTATDIGPRGQYFHLGTVEMVALLAGAVVTVIRFIRKPHRNLTVLDGALIVTGVIIFFTLSVSEPLYRALLPLNNIQHPWRMLTALIFLPPFILAYLLDQMKALQKYQYWLAGAAVLLICGLRFPQLYGKNYIWYPDSFYYFTPINLHGEVLNTIWTGSSRDYSIQSQKAQIIGGNGQIAQMNVLTGQRQYQVSATTPIRMVDYTFYFPGWKAYVDGQEVPIEFQDMNYRGVITYQVPEGNHQVMLRFEDTKMRLLGKVVTVSTVISLVMIYFCLRLRNSAKSFSRPSKKKTAK